MGAQRGVDHLGDIADTDAKGFPAGGIERFEEFLFLEQLRPLDAGAGAAIFDNAFLHAEGGMAVDEIFNIAHRNDRRGAFENAQQAVEPIT